MNARTHVCLQAHLVERVLDVDARKSIAVMQHDRTDNRRRTSDGVSEQCLLSNIRLALVGARTPVGFLEIRQSPKVERPPTPPPPTLPVPKKQPTCKIPSSIHSYLIEPGEGSARPEQEVDTQTDAFEERPQTPDFVPKKTGVDASTQIEVSDKLFDFEAEVQPMLAVLVGKVK